MELSFKTVSNSFLYLLIVINLYNEIKLSILVNY